MNVAERSQTEAISSTGVDVSVDRDRGASAADFEGLADLGIELEVAHGTPVLRGRLSRQQSAYTASDFTTVATPCISRILHTRRQARLAKKTKKSNTDNPFDSQ